ncbi:unnamed protein product [Nezara viridula]|uniref:Uncharacterized protein n=1 Tax=Nezara viridula TaxID=85310 RepID=A0A9P0HPV0_NEZVI|nr:unnamed protein product [Nezara viridula]
MKRQIIGRGGTLISSLQLWLCDGRGARTKDLGKKGFNKKDSPLAQLSLGNCEWGFRLRMVGKSAPRKKILLSLSIIRLGQSGG